MKKGRLQEIVKELQGASKMHLKQSKEIDGHIDDMGSPAKKTIGDFVSVASNFLKGGAGIAASMLSTTSARGGQLSNRELKAKNPKGKNWSFDQQDDYKTELLNKPKTKFKASPARRGRGDSYKKGELIDETDHEDSMYKTTNSPDKLISGTSYNVENVSKIQSDKKGQFMTSLDQSEYYGGPKPTSSTVSNYDQGRNQTRDTLRPAIGKKFKKTY